MRRRLCLLLICGAVLFPAADSRAQCGPDESAFVADRDNTLYEDGSGALSNGAGEFVFAGRTGGFAGNRRHRAILHFDVSSIPPDSVVAGSTVWLNASRVASATGEDMSLHPVTADWGEGTSNAGNPGGGGAPSTAGDATWVHSSYMTSFWATPGGDFSPAASATTAVGGTGLYAWGSNAAMAADVQAWVDDPAANYGWILIGNEASTFTAKRFDSRENASPGARPVLCVAYAAAPTIDVPALDEIGLLVLALALAALAVRQLR